MIDGGEADDKIIAVLEKDTFWGDAQDITERPENQIERLRPDFATAKIAPATPN